MNSFLFNVWLLLLCAVSCVQFCFGAFQSYAQLTAIDMLLGVQVRCGAAGRRSAFSHAFVPSLPKPARITHRAPCGPQVRNLIALSWFFQNNFF